MSIRHKWSCKMTKWQSVETSKLNLFKSKSQLSHHHNLLSTFNWNNDNAIESPSKHMRCMHVYVNEHTCVDVLYICVRMCLSRSYVQDVCYCFPMSTEFFVIRKQQVFSILHLMWEKRLLRRRVRCVCMLSMCVCESVWICGQHVQRSCVLTDFNQLDLI